MELIFYGELDSQSGGYIAWRKGSGAVEVYGFLAAVERPVIDGADDRVWCSLDYSSYDLQIRRNGEKFSYTVNYF